MLGVMRRLWIAIGLVLVTACGNASVRLSASVDEDVRQRLLAAADRAAAVNDGEAKHVEAVRTTRGRAADLTGNSGTEPDQEIWVVQVSGTNYSCGLCSRPAGSHADLSHMRYITLVLRASDYGGTDAGLRPRPTDLGRFGEVEVLRA